MSKIKVTSDNHKRKSQAPEAINDKPPGSCYKTWRIRSLTKLRTVEEKAMDSSDNFEVEEKIYVSVKSFIQKSSK